MMLMARSEFYQKRYARWLAMEAICLQLSTVLYSPSLGVAVWAYPLRASLLLSHFKILFDY